MCSLSYTLSLVAVRIVRHNIISHLLTFALRELNIAIYKFVPQHCTASLCPALTVHTAAVYRNLHTIGIVYSDT